MVEETQGGVSENHLMLISSGDAFGIHHTPIGRSEVFDTALPGAVDIIREGEEGVTRAHHIHQLSRMLLLLFACQRGRNLTLYEEGFPLSLFTSFEEFSADEQVDSVGFVSTLDACFEGHGEDTWVVSEPPVVSFGARETGAVDARLLAGS